MAQIDLKALEAEALEAEALAAAAEPTEEEKKAHAFLERRAVVREKAAGAAREKREVDGAIREGAAKKTAGKSYLVRAVDLVSFFPFGEAPPIEQFPGGGVIIVRNPSPDRQAAVTSAMEAKKRKLEPIFIDLVCDTTVDPAPEDVGGGAMLRAFLEAYPGAASNAAGIVLELGGLRQEAAKRGSL